MHCILFSLHQRRGSPADSICIRLPWDCPARSLASTCRKTTGFGAFEKTLLGSFCTVMQLKQWMRKIALLYIPRIRQTSLSWLIGVQEDMLHIEPRWQARVSLICVPLDNYDI